MDAVRGTARANSPSMDESASRELNPRMPSHAHLWRTHLHTHTHMHTHTRIHAHTQAHLWRSSQAVSSAAMPIPVRAIAARGPSRPGLSAKMAVSCRSCCLRYTRRAWHDLGLGVIKATTQVQLARGPCSPSHTPPTPPLMRTAWTIKEGRHGDAGEGDT